MALCSWQTGYTQLYEFKDHGKWGLMDNTGAIVLEAAYDYLFTDSSASWYFLKQQRKSGLYRIGQGKIFAPEYDNYFFDAPGVIRVVKQGKYGAADTLGKLKISADYDALVWLGEGIYALRIGKLWGAASMDGTVNIPIQYERIDALSQEAQMVLVCKNINGSSSLWNEQGELLSEDLPYEIESVYGGVFVYRMQERLGLMNRNGTRLTEPIFDKLSAAPPLFLAQQGDSLGLLDLNGGGVLPVIHTDLMADTASRWWFQRDKLWGLIAGTEVLFEPLFSDYQPFNNEVAIVSKKNKKGLINGFGNFLAEPIYDDITCYERTARLVGGDGRGQVSYDAQGRPDNALRIIVSGRQAAPKVREFTPARIARAGKFSGNNATRLAGWYVDMGLWGLRDTANGTLLISPQYAFAEVVSNDPPLSIVSQRVPGSEQRGLLKLMDHVKVSELTEFAFRKVMGKDFLHSAYARIEGLDGTLGYLDTQGKIMRINAATFLGFFQKGTARIRFRGKRIPLAEHDSPETERLLQSKTADWDFIRPNRDYVLQPLSYQYISKWTHGMALFIQGRQWGVLDSTFTERIPAQYDWITDPGPKSKLLIIEENARKIGFYQENGNFLHSSTLSTRIDSNALQIESIGTLSEALLPIEIRNNWGYMDISGELVITPQFQAVKPFSGGLAAAKLKGQWGYIDRSGNWIIKARYRNGESFRSGVARIRAKSGWGYLSPNGKWLVRPKLRKAEDFKAGYAIARDRNWGLLNAKGKWSIKANYASIEAFGDTYRLRKDGKFSYQTVNGKKLIPEVYTWLGEANEEKIAFLKDSRYGYLNLQAEVLIPPQYKKAGYFSNGLAPVRMDTAWGYINAQNDTIISPVYDQAMPFYHGLAAVAKKVGRRQYTWGLINRDGLAVVPLVHSQMEAGSDGWFLGKTESGWIFYDTLGIQMNQGFFEIASSFQQQRTSLSLNQLTYIFNTHGNPILNPGHKQIQASDDQIYVTQTDRLFGLMDRFGKVLVEPKYEHIRYHNGLFQIIENGKVGYMNAAGEWLHPLSD